MLSFNALGQFGRLGNQMFQYATLVSLAKNAGVEFCIPPSTASDEYKEHQLFQVFKLPSLKIAGWQLNPTRIAESSFAYDPSVIAAAQTGCGDLHGYFQSEKYFLNHRVIIEREFQFKDETRDLCQRVKVGLGRDVIGLHVRRSDYVQLSDYHPPCSLDYYEAALQHFPSDHAVFVFSDDIAWCKEQPLFRGNRFFFSDQGTNAFDLCLMSMCDHHIIANSSFSWWGAWLGWTPKRRVIAPSRWFGPSGPKDSQDLIPDSWVIL